MTGTTAAAREALVDALVHDALAALGVAGRRRRSPAAAAEAAELLALVAGQDVDAARTACSASPAGSPPTG